MVHFAGTSTIVLHTDRQDADNAVEEVALALHFGTGSLEPSQP
jgi:hypothetical protein